MLAFFFLPYSCYILRLPYLGSRLECLHTRTLGSSGSYRPLSWHRAVNIQGRSASGTRTGPQKHVNVESPFGLFLDVLDEYMYMYTDTCTDVYIHVHIYTYIHLWVPGRELQQLRPRSARCPCNLVLQRCSDAGEGRPIQSPGRIPRVEPPNLDSDTPMV